jgi:hypothetical protein
LDALVILVVVGGGVGGVGGVGVGVGHDFVLL